jgi:hypothetical protein
VLAGVGSFGAYPASDPHNELGNYIPVTNYYEGYYGLTACNKGAEWAILYGGPWECYILGSFWLV